MLIELTREVSVNPAAVLDVVLESRSYANCSGPTVLTVTMMDGRCQRIEHNPWMLGGVDAYRIKERLENASKEVREDG